MCCNAVWIVKKKELKENHRECNYANKSARLQGKERK